MKYPSDEFVGQLVLGRYRIVGVLAKGGMGVIYLARSEGAAGFVKPVVIKRILSDMDEDHAVVSMFKREARIMSNLRHPGIVGVMDFGRDQKSYFMVLEYIHGFHLGRWMKYNNIVHGRFSFEFALHIVIQVLDALHYAHTLTAPDGSSLQIVHRDVTPSNVLIDVEGHVKLADFGIARMRTDATEAGQGEAMIKGKFPYLAPELLHGGNPTPISDVYGCGVVLHEVLIGKNVFRAPSLSMTVARVMHHVPEALHSAREDISPAFNALVARALAKKPEDRFQSALEFAQALRAMRPEAAETTHAKLAKAAAADFFDQRMAELLDVDNLPSLDRLWRQAPDADRMGFRAAKYVSSKPPGRVSPSDPVDMSADAELARHDSIPIDLPMEVDAADARHQVSAGWRGRTALIAVAIISLIATAVGGLAWYTASRQQRPRQFVYVASERADGQDPAASSPEKPQPSATVAEPPPQGQASTPIEKAVERSRNPRGAAPAATKAPQPNANQLTATIRSHDTKLSSCFAEHVPDRPIKASLRFSITKAGLVQSVDVQPGELSNTPLGQCLLRVARAISFGTQAGDLVFTVPISAQAK